MKTVMTAKFLVLMAMVGLSASNASATPGDGLCSGKVNGTKYEILMARTAIDAHPDDYEEVSINGVPVARFPESAFDFTFKNVGTEDKPMILNSRTAIVGDDRMEIVYPEQDPESDTWTIYLDLKVPSKSLDLSGIELTCQN
ncbi:MAG: hypothetical protein J0L82_02890 [Deltaproteobacteria bacterium]|nr:hypothetical protein [Deltaproteobacteria bacterium]